MSMFDNVYINCYEIYRRIDDESLERFKKMELELGTDMRKQATLSETYLGRDL